MLARQGGHGPKLDDHDLLAFDGGQIHGFAFDPFGDFQRRRGVTEFSGKGDVG